MEFSKNAIFRPPPTEDVRKKSTASNHVCEIVKCQDMRGLGRPKPNSPDAKLEVPETIDPNPKTNLLMTICLP